MKTILCFGDSNTWGYDPSTRLRFDPSLRWTGMLQRGLGAGYRVIEEGLNGRTTVWDDPLSPGRNGLTYLRPCLESHQPLDVVTIMLGTNDLKRRFGLAPSDIAEGAGVLAQVVKQTLAVQLEGAPRVLLIAPPPTAKLTKLAGMFDGAGEKSREFSTHYRRNAEWNGCAFLDAGRVVQSSDLDGIHFEAPEHRKLAEAVAVEIRRMIET
ncbi:MAG TPA: SGNH/GDSL hydrolase family protein [Thermomicrobiales bacterium]|nr:SGNH/GDSL hydrolase family protein [Thermomicrobiales bacterium]